MSSQGTDPRINAVNLTPSTEKVVEKLTAAILDMVELYCSTFNANFHTVPQSQSCTAPIQEAGLVTNVLSFNVYAAHRIPITWAARYVAANTHNGDLSAVVVRPPTGCV